MKCGSRSVDARGEAPARRACGRLVVGVTGLVVGLTGCAIVQPGTVATNSPTASATSVASSPAASPSPTLPTDPGSTLSSSPTATPTATSTAGSAVKATGSLLTYSNLVSDQLTGTCRTKKNAPTLTLSEAANDFYGTVEVVVVLESGRQTVASVRSDFGEDFEGVARKLVHPDTGTSATVSAKGSTYTVTGKLRMYEGSSKQGTLVPFTITATCAGTDW